MWDDSPCPICKGWASCKCFDFPVVQQPPVGQFCPGCAEPCGQCDQEALD